MRRTKIVATLGPATESPEMIRKLVAAGMNVARLNMSHAPHDWIRRIVPEIRAAAQEQGKFVGILLDTQGPAIRTGDLPTKLDLIPGQKFTFTVRGETREEHHSVDVNYENFVNDISVGDIVLVDNGTIHMRVLAKNGNKVECEVLTPGQLGSRRHINLPGVKVSLPALTSKDLADVAVGLELGVDFIALSFVREAKDILQLRAVISSAARPPLIVAKIEDQEAVKNLDSIVAEADAIMIARGDLGIECPYEELPIIQRRIAKTCLQVGKPFIIATHMLESMIENPHPTRAEVTDVANAVFEQADAIMLSGETTVGRQPLKCIEVMDKIACRIERSGGLNSQDKAQLVTQRQKLVKSAVVMANELKAEAIVVLTFGGHMARAAAWMRPRHSPIFVACESVEVARSLSLNWGLTPKIVAFDRIQPENTIHEALKLLQAEGVLKPGNTAVVIGAVSTGTQIIDAVQMRRID
jgi:pyruvate kinase